MGVAVGKIISRPISILSLRIWLGIIMMQSSHGLSEEQHQAPVLQCFEDKDTRDTHLLIRDPDNSASWLKLVEFSFPEVGWFTRLDSCRAWVISTLDGEDIAWDKIKPVKLLASKTKEARIALGDAPKIYPLCSESDRCTLNIPYRWHWSLWKDVFYKKSASLPGYCYTKAERPEIDSLPSADLTSKIYPNLGYVSSWTEPESNLATEVMKMTENMRDQTVVVSTMQWSSSQLKKLKDHLTSRNIKAYVIGDLEIWLSGAQRNASELPRFSDERFVIIPAFRTPRYTSSHHMKGAVVTNKDGDFAFTSSNLTSGDEGIFREFGVHGKNQDFAVDWLAAVKELITDYCVERNRLACVLPHHVQKNDIFNLEIEETLARGCRSFFADNQLTTISSARESKSRMLLSEQYNMTQTILDFLAAAKKSVKATVNQISSQEIIQRFESIQKLPVMLYVGDSVPSEDPMRPKQLKHIATPSDLPHTKAILVDGEKLFWGTGNFTKTGLSSLRELFFVTSDPAVISSYSKFYSEIEASEKAKSLSK